jgi:glycosyltransferase involved in cell wall biosynthesis
MIPPEESRASVPTLSVITPTLGRESLKAMLDSLLPQLTPDDEVLVIGDGPRPRAGEICASYGNPVIKYWEIPLTMNFGNPQRNEALKIAKCSHIHFLDDDDLSMDGAISTIKKVAVVNPGRPLMFRMPYTNTVIWRSQNIQVANVSGQMFVLPNDTTRMGRWSGKYGADYDFISSTCALYPPGSVVWREELIAHQGLAGKEGAGGREI